MVYLNWGADINVGQMEVMQRVTQILNQLPPRDLPTIRI
jgi:hypothetical protein